MEEGVSTAICADSGAGAARVLLIDGNPADATLLQRALATGRRPAFSVSDVATLRAASGRLASERFDVILLELDLLDSRGLDTLGAVRTAAPHTPVVVISRHDDETGVAALQGGAQDHLVKATLGADSLIRSLRHAMCRDQAAAGLLDAARGVMHRAREAEVSDYRFFAADMYVDPVAPVRAACELAAALDRGEFILDYQPLIRLHGDLVDGAEALVRWNHPTRGLIPPEDFIPVAEDSGLIVELGRQVLSAVCSHARAWHDAGLDDLRMAVNLSARQFRSAFVVADVSTALRDSGLPPRCLELEITESVFADADRTGEILRELRALGVRIAIDDFGRGFSSLSYLSRFPVDTIKIDRTFVSAITTDPDKQVIVAAVVAMARQLRLEVVAEGVEAPEELEYLRAIGCQLAQGFLFSRPVPPDAFEHWARRRRSGLPPDALRRDAARRRCETGRTTAPRPVFAARGLRLAGDFRAGVRRAPARLAARMGLQTRTARRRLGGLAAIAGAGLGAIVALPVELPPPSACPPPGEGLVQCQLQKAWLPAVTTVSLIAAAFCAASVWLVDLPARWREFRRLRRLSREGPRNADALLAAASWGQIPGAAGRRGPGRREPEAA